VAELVVWLPGEEVPYEPGLVPSNLPFMRKNRAILPTIQPIRAKPVVWEWINSWVNEIHYMSRIGRVTMLVELAPIKTIDKQAHRTLQCLGATRETPRRAGQARQVMAQLGVVAFHREGVGFTCRHFGSAPVIPQAVVGFKRSAGIVSGLGSRIHQLLKGRLGAFPDDFPAQIAARLAVYTGEDVDPVFLWPIKVNNSSISASFTSAGKGTSAKLAARVLTHKETVR
jgi:hypothetical protein